MLAKSYEIHLAIDFEGLKYSGKELIVLSRNDMDEIALNSVGLEISGVYNDQGDLEYHYDMGKGIIHITNTGALDEVRIDFSGKIPFTSSGLYAVSGNYGKSIAAQFGPSYARTVFPCFDHPGEKSQFRISLVIDKDYDAISNMPPEDTSYENNNKVITFERTPLMSTYLLYIGVGKFMERSLESGNKTIYLATLQSHPDVSVSVLHMAKSAIKFFEDYTGIDFALPKLHLVSVPKKGGAMENWGAIALDQDFIIQSGALNTSRRKRTAQVISHEVAHQWFGDLVTMVWWNDMWLNESFATFMASRALIETNKEWNVEADFLMADFKGAIWRDSSNYTVPIAATVSDPKAVAYLPTEIRYGKGASVLRMLESYIGSTSFRDGIRLYLEKYKYGNAKGSDLWECIDEVSGEHVSAIMQNWTTLKGYPLITVQKENGVLNLIQSRFSLSSSKDAGGNWPVPVFIRRRDSSATVLMSEKSMELADGGIVTLNSEQCGFYRVFYEGATYFEIVANKSSLKDIEKWGVVNDLFAFLHSGLISFEKYLEMIKPFLEDDDSLVIDEVSTQFIRLARISDKMEFKHFAVSVLRNQLSRKGWLENDVNDDNASIRGKLIYRLVTLDDNFQKELLQSANIDMVPPDFRLAFLTASVLENGYEDDIGSFMTELEKTSSRKDIIMSLGWAPSAESLSGPESLIREEKIAGSDVLLFYETLAENKLVRGYIAKNIRKIVTSLNSEKFRSGSGWHFLERVIPIVGSDDEQEARAYLKEIETQDSSEMVDRCREFMDAALRVKKEIDDIWSGNYHRYLGIT